MKKIFISLVCGIAAVGLFGSRPVSAISLAPCPDDESKSQCEAEQAEILRRWEAGEPTIKTIDSESTNPPATFVAEFDSSEQSAGLWAGKNLLFAGNNLTVKTDVKNGLFLVAGNNLQLKNHSEYGFVFGNIINFAGTTERDLYVAGNSVTLTSDAEIGRDVFVASSELAVESDLYGDLSVTADLVRIADDVIIDGNVNIDANIIEFGNDIIIGGKLVYNDTADVSGANHISYNDLEVYHVQEESEEALLVAAFYSKLLSIAGLFLAMTLILALYPRLHEKTQAIDTAGHFGTNLSIGLGTLVIVPMVALLCLLVMVAAPVGIIALLVYGISIYLAQGFTGLWLGHTIIKKLIKVETNAFVKALVGVTILGLLSLVPFVGVITGFVSLAFGLGFIIYCVKPSRPDKNSIDPSVKDLGNSGKLIAQSVSNSKSSTKKSSTKPTELSKKSTKTSNKTEQE